MNRNWAGRLGLSVCAAVSLSLFILFTGVNSMAQDDGAQDEEAQAAEQQDAHATDAIAAFAQVAEVFRHPRCANCHVAGDQPWWTDRPHGMNVQRGLGNFGRAGMRCTVCHSDVNSPEKHGAPGAPFWHLPPAEMVWLDQTDRQICEQIKDPERNGDKTLEEVVEHVREDALVAWGWDPGPGREPAPLSARETADLLEVWMAAGAPCPES